jgi:putative methionine-R-sulfoxide reductase with GAF domain/HAMP domain-containing protein
MQTSVKGAGGPGRPLAERLRVQRQDAIVSLTILTFALAVQSVATFQSFGGDEAIIAALVPILAALLMLFGILIVQGGSTDGGVGLGLVALGTSFLYVTIRFSGLGLLSAISFSLVAGTLTAQCLSPRRRTPTLIAGIIVALLLVLLEIFWPWERRVSLARNQALLMWLSMVLPLTVLVLNLRQYRQFKLQTKLVTSFLLISLLPLLTTVLLNNLATRQALIDDANDSLLAAARQTAVTLDDFFANQLSTIRTEATLLAATGYFGLAVEERSGSPAEAEALELLKTFRDKNPLNISSYAVIDREGAVILEYPVNLRRMNESDRPYIRTPLASGQPYASGVEFSPFVGGPFLYFSSPIRDEADQLVGVVRARYKASILQQIIARSTGLVGGQSYAALFDENNLHLAHGTFPEVIFKLTRPLPVEQVALLQDDMRLPRLPVEQIATNLPELAGQLDAQRAGQAAEPVFAATDVATGERLDQVAVASLQSQPWLVAFLQPQDVFLAPVQNQTQAAILLSVLVSVLVVVLALSVARLLTEPISRLEGVAARISRGDLEARAEIEAQDEIGSLAETFNLMTDQLRATLGTLEQRVIDRTRALATSTEVGRRLSTILEQERLVSEVVTQVQQAFDYYHVHIYLFDPSGRYLNMVGGTGRPGAIMLSRGHRIEKGKGLVGRAADANAVVLVADVRQDPDWLPNPLLPKTRSEVAVPIAVGEQVLGVLDVQDQEVNALGQEDADLLLSIANQVAIALQNAYSYAQIQREASRRALINEINRKIQAAPDMDSALQIAVRELGRAVGARTARAWVGDVADGANGNPPMAEE